MSESGRNVSDIILASPQLQLERLQRKMDLQVHQKRKLCREKNTLILPVTKTWTEEYRLTLIEKIRIEEIASFDLEKIKVCEIFRRVIKKHSDNQEVIAAKVSGVRRGVNGYGQVLCPLGFFLLAMEVENISVANGEWRFPESVLNRSGDGANNSVRNVLVGTIEENKLTRIRFEAPGLAQNGIKGLILDF